MFSRKLQNRVGGQKICSQCSTFEKECVPFIYFLEQQDDAPESTIILEPRKFTLYDSFLELEDSARRGCDTCLVWRKAIMNECYSREDERKLVDPNQAKGIVELEPPSTWTRPSRSSPHLNIKIFVGRKASIDHIRGERVNNNDTAPLQTVVKIGFPSTDYSGDPKIQQNPRFEGIWQRTAELLKHCAGGQTAHKLCKMQVGHSSLPRRLVRIHDDMTITVCETGKMPQVHAQSLDYAALSYVWGPKGSQTIKLTREHEPDLIRGISQGEFPNTIAHTFEVCRLLRISYVWIDALCIRQDDGGADFQSESGRMDVIYGSAAITLVISTAESAREGFLMPRTLEEHKIDVKWTRFANGKLSIPRKGIDEVRAKSPLALRGWCFQEELLSRRLLYVTGHGLFWSCPEVQRAEHRNHEGDIPEFESVTDVLPPHFFIKSQDRLYVWDRLVEQYAVRNLSRASDRLPAVRGLARSIEEQTGEEFLYGMWRSRLPVQLLWTTIGVTAPIPRVEDSERDAVKENIPSWSWASTFPLQAVRMPGPEISYAKAKLLDNDSLDSHACLTLQGRKRALLIGHRKIAPSTMRRRTSTGGSSSSEVFDQEISVWAIDEREIMVREEGREEPVVIKLDRSASVDFEELVCFEINYKGFLLLERVSHGHYRRVGCSQLHADPAFFVMAEIATIKLL